MPGGFFFLFLVVCFILEFFKQNISDKFSCLTFYSNLLKQRQVRNKLKICLVKHTHTHTHTRSPIFSLSKKHLFCLLFIGISFDQPAVCLNFQSCENLTLYTLPSLCIQITPSCWWQSFGVWMQWLGSIAPGVASNSPLVLVWLSKLGGKNSCHSYVLKQKACIFI